MKKIILSISTLLLTSNVFAGYLDTKIYIDGEALKLSASEVQEGGDSRYTRFSHVVLSRGHKTYSVVADENQSTESKGIKYIGKLICDNLAQETGVAQKVDRFSYNYETYGFYGYVSVNPAERGTYEATFTEKNQQLFDVTCIAK